MRGVYFAMWRNYLGSKTSLQRTMKSLKTICLMVLFLISSRVWAQTQISGKIAERGKSISEVIVTVRNRENAIIAYCFSDSLGRYAVSFTSNSDSVTVGHTGFNIKQKPVKLANRPQVYDFNVLLESHEIAEVFVAAPKVYSRGDTVNYTVKELAKITDISIEDLLKRLPGIKVLESGKILYNNEPISNFYVEGLDLMGGRYSMITQKITPKLVQTVQVLENHQNVKALRDVTPTNKAAINLKLCPEVVNIWKYSAEVGGGLEYDDDLLWLASFNAMKLGKENQSFSGAETDNVGKTPRAQNDFFDGGNNTSLLSVDRIANPPIAT